MGLQVPAVTSSVDAGDMSNTANVARSLCQQHKEIDRNSDPLNWARAAAAIAGKHLEEVKQMIVTYCHQSSQVAIEGVSPWVKSPPWVAGWK